MKELELRELWRRYKREGDAGARERLVVAYSPMVKFVAGRPGAGLPSHVEDADLISYGLMGLIGAIERFEPERGIKFETFAMTRIRGAIIDELRSLDWVPRSVRLARARNRGRPARSSSTSCSGRPTEDELAEKLGHDRGRAAGVAAQIANSSVYALEELWIVSDASGDQVSLLDTIADPSARRPPGRRSTAARSRTASPRRSVAARARAAGRRPLLLREPDPARDRRGPRRHRVAGLPAAHEGRDAPALRSEVDRQLALNS